MMRPRTIILSFLVFCALLYPLVLWQKERIFSSIPAMDDATSWFWIAQPIVFALFFFALSAGIRKRILCYACIIAASFFFTFAVAEVYFRLQRFAARQADTAFHSPDSVHVKSGQATHLYEKGYSVPDPVLGYGPNEKTRIAARSQQGDKVIYDVLYSKDGENRRITPDHGDKADAAILLFGCSFTFGEGLNDRETFAWQLGEMLGERFQVFNFGFHGYGSHQMLALVESGRLDSLTRRYKQVYAFYLTIRSHEPRCLGLGLGPGLWQWDENGPRYILENGVLKYAGKFSGTKLPQLPEYPLLERLFPHSKLYVEAKLAYHRWLLSDLGFNTHAAIIAKSMQELHTRYHAHALTVIWPDYTRIEQKLRDSGVRTLLLTDAMPDYASTPKKYELEVDRHPNALANTRIAQALAAYILKNTHTTGEWQ